MDESPPQPSPRAKILRAAAGILIAAFVAAVFAHHSVLHQVERWTFETLSRLDPPAAQGVVVIDIDDAAFAAHFNGTTPLDPATLAQLIGAIAAGAPKVIGVDIDTSSPRFASFALDPSWPPIVWARGLLPDDEPDAEVRPGDADQPYRLRAGGVLGRTDAALLAASGLPVLIADDSDRRVRRYRQAMSIAGEPPLATLPRAIAERAGATGAGADTRARIIQYAPSAARLRVRAGDVFTLGPTEGWRGPAGPLRDRIVILGGSYAGQDRHATPLGQMRGADIVASVVETELRGGGQEHPGWLRLFVIEIFGAIVVAMLLYAVRSAWLGAAILVAALVVLAPLSSLAVYGTVDRWLYFGLVYLAAAGVNFYESLSLKFANKREKQLAEAIEHLRDRFGRRRVANGGKP